jgi:glycosyltransferase involved in cell wall biosynthesis
MARVCSREAFGSGGADDVPGMSSAEPGPGERRRLRVTHIVGSDSGGGAELATYQLHRQLLAHGHASVMLVGRKVRPDEEVVPIPRLRGPWGALKLTQALESTFGLQYLYSPGFRAVDRLVPAATDVVHLHGFHGTEGYADIGALPGLTRRWPCVLTVHDMWMLTGHCAYSAACDRWKTGCGKCPDLTLYPPIPRDGTRLNWLRKRWVLGRSRLSLATSSEWMAAKLKASPLLGGFPLHVIPNAVDTTVFRPAEDRPSLRAALSLPPDKVVVLLVANFLDLPWKGMDDAAAALNSLSTAGLMAVIIGRNGAGLAQKLRVPSLVVPYQSTREDLARWYAAADMLVIPSLEEVFGMVAAEAMACATPVIAYATGGLPEVVGDAEGGVVVPRGDIARLAGAIASLAQDGALRRDLGQRGVRRAETRFSLPRHASLYEALYESVIAGPATPRAHGRGAALVNA